MTNVFPPLVGGVWGCLQGGERQTKAGQGTYQTHYALSLWLSISFFPILDCYDSVFDTLIATVLSDLWATPYKGSSLIVIFGSSLGDCG